MNNHAEYFSVPALNSSLAKKLVVSAAHGRGYMVNPPNPSPSMQLGTAAHTVVFEPHKTPFVMKQLNWTTKEGKAERELLQATGLPILDQGEVAAVMQIRENVMAIPEVAAAIEKGITEAPAYWEQRGVSCKARADLIHDGVIYDLKTCQDASPRAFMSSIWKYGYHISARHYMDGFGAKRFILIAAETTPPYAVALYDLSDGMLAIGDQLLDVAARRYAHGLATGEWPGFGSSVMTLGTGAIPTE